MVDHRQTSPTKRLNRSIKTKKLAFPLQLLRVDVSVVKQQLRGHLNMRLIREEIAKRIAKNHQNKINPWPDKPTPITWGQFKEERVIDVLLDTGGDVSLTVADIAREMNCSSKEIEDVIDRLLSEEFIVKEEHWLLESFDNAGQYKLNLDGQNISETLATPPSEE